MINAFAQEFIEQSAYRMEESTERVIKCLHEIDEAQAWKSANTSTNSIGNLTLHLCGNIRQYVISALGNIADTRERDKEFSTKDAYTKNELSGKLTETISQAVYVMKNTGEEALIKKYSVQGFNLSGIGIIIHVTEHYSYHTGQIVFWTKQITGKDLGFYSNINLNIKNSN